MHPGPEPIQHLFASTAIVCPPWVGPERRMVSGVGGLPSRLASVASVGASIIVVSLRLPWRRSRWQWSALPLENKRKVSLRI